MMSTLPPNTNTSGDKPYLACELTPGLRTLRRTGLKNRGDAKSTGSDGDHTFPNVSGARSAKTTAHTAQPGNSFPTTMPGRAPIAGAKTQSWAFATGIS